MSKRLAEINAEYERILHSDKSNEQKDKALAHLMTTMEGEFKIPSLRDESFEKKHRTVIALYRKLSQSRTLD